MVEDREVGAEKKAQFGEAKIVNGVLPDALQPAHDVVGEVSDQPAEQRRVAGIPRRGQSPLRRPQHRERLARLRHTRRRRTVRPHRHAVAFGQRGSGADAHEGIARPRTPVLGGLEQEGPRPATQLAVDTDGRLRVREQPARHGDDGVPGRQ